MLPGRTILDQELNNLRSEILRLFSMVDNATDQAMTALYNRDVALAQTVITGDQEANQLRYEIEEKCLLILATQQPAARDLRTVIAAVHLAVELERIGDYAVGIARLVQRMEDEAEIGNLHKLPKMARRARQMVQQGIKAYAENNVALALDMVKWDDKIDKQYNKLFQETLLEMSDSDYVRRATYLLWVGHNLERIGDRATNIAERVIFMATGELTEELASLE